ncbi:MAG: CAP domain-containing protein [Methanoregula sp.]|jgi:uncharacterized protein YkwD
MRQLSLPVIISLLGGGIVLVLVLLFTGTILWPGFPPATAGQLPMETPVGSLACTTSPAHVTSIILTPSPSPTQTTIKTTIPAPAPAKKSINPTTPRITVAAESSALDPYTISTTVLEQRVHELINQQRTAEGLAAVSFDPALADIAKEHSEDMATQNYFSHVNLAGENPTDRGTAAGYSCRKEYGSYYTYGIAENLFQNNLYSSVTYYSNGKTVYNWNSPEEIAQITVAGWMNSSGHRENILTPTFDREGIGVAIASDDKVYITEDFC